MRAEAILEFDIVLPIRNKISMRAGPSRFQLNIGV